jgi:aminoglycoside 6'-N-acetyltransferase
MLASPSTMWKVRLMPNLSRYAGLAAASSRLINRSTWRRGRTRLWAVRITTERLVLRTLRDGDETDLLEYRGRDDVSRYLETEPLTPESVKDFVSERAGADRIEREGDRIMLAVERSGRVVGDVRLGSSGVLRDRQGEIGWVFHPGYGGKGYATEAAGALIRLGFEDVGLHRIWAQLDPRNIGSARLCERLGMRHEGLLREESWFKGEWGDLSIYGLLAREWRDRPATS